MQPSKRPGRFGDSRGFSLMQMIVTAAVVIVIVSFAVVRIVAARDHMRLTTSSREFASYVEKARIDSIRRHERGGAATITIQSQNSYRVLLDFDYSGAPETRVYTLPEGVTVSNVEVTQANGAVTSSATLPVNLTFDWRGRSSTSLRVTFQNSRQQTSVVGITRAGEISLDRKSISLLTGDYDPVGGDLTPTGALPTGETGGGTGGTGSTGTGSTGTGSTGTGSTGTGSTGTGSTGTGSTGTGSTGTGSTGTGSTGTGSTGTGSTGTGSTGTGSTGTGSTGGTTTGSTQQPCTMTLTPDATNSSNALPLHNGGNGTDTVTITATFNNPDQGAFISSVGEYPSSSSHLTVSFSGTQITIKAQNGAPNRGVFTVRVTPGASCGGPKDFYVNVAK